MKKKIMIIGIMLLVIFINCITIYGATTSNVTLQSDKTEVKAGETFTVVVKVQSPDGINGIDTTYTYDTEKLDLIKADRADTNFADISGQNGKIVLFVNVATPITDTNLYALTFKVKEGVPANSIATIALGKTYLETLAQLDSEHTIPEQSITIKVIEQTTLPAGSDTECEHTYGNYTDNGDGKHSAICSKCGEKHTEDHTYKDGACSVCGAKENVETKCEHTYGKYTDNKDGKHSATCTKCGEKHTEAHTYKDGVCSACGVKQASNNGKNDDTANKEYPKAGVNVVLFVSIVAVVIVAVAIYKKNQKYKDII